MSRHESMPLADALTHDLPLTERQLAEFLQCSVKTLRRLVAQGLPAYKVGHSRRFDVAAVREWLRETLPQLSNQSAGLHVKN